MMGEPDGLLAWARAHRKPWHVRHAAGIKVAILLGLYVLAGILDGLLFP